MSIRRELALVEVHGVGLRDVACAAALQFDIQPNVSYRQRQGSEQLRVIPRLPGVPGDPRRTVLVTDLGGGQFGVEWNAISYPQARQRVDRIRGSALSLAAYQELLRLEVV